MGDGVPRGLKELLDQFRLSLAVYLDRIETKLCALQAQGDTIMADVRALMDRVTELEAQAEAGNALQAETANTLTELLTKIDELGSGGATDQATIDDITARLTVVRDKNQAAYDAGAAAEQAADPTP